MNARELSAGTRIQSFSRNLWVDPHFTLAIILRVEKHFVLRRITELSY